MAIWRCEIYSRKEDEERDVVLEKAIISINIHTHRRTRGATFILLVRTRTQARRLFLISPLRIIEPSKREANLFPA